jgi:glyoxylase-like metal-dependent hydrolase (beta-lactamase superfamily II)
MRDKVSIEEAPSTVGATYVEPSATRHLGAGEKLDRLTSRNLSEPYLLQRLTDRAYWFQRQFYSTTFYVGDEGVLVFDALQWRAANLLDAIAEVTPLPITTIVYTHDHADHIGDAPVLLEAASQQRIVATEATAEKLGFLGSALPAPTDVVEWPIGSFRFEDLTVQVNGFERAAHTDDHSAWLLVDEKVVHAPDLLNPDQLPFRNLAGAENFVYHEDNVRQVAALDWTYLNGGHGNIGAKADTEFQLHFAQDLREAVTAAMGAEDWASYLKPDRANNHAAYTEAWSQALVRRATESLRGTYGQYYGFDTSVPLTAALAVHAVMSYQ